MAQLDCKHDADSRAEILRDVYLENQHMITKTSFNRQKKVQRVVLKSLKIRKTAMLLILLNILLIQLFSKNLSTGIYNVPEIHNTNKEPERITASFAENVDEKADLTMYTKDTSVSTIPRWIIEWTGNQLSLNDFNLLLDEYKNIELSSLFGLGVKTVVIDPGHGGRDPGAIGANGTMEKEITLDVSIKLKDRLDKLTQFNVLLTRNEDITLSLADRVAFAKGNNADLFVSIHVNALPNKSVNIIETYYFGAPRSSETLRLAELENSGSHFSMAELDLILADFENTLKRQESAKLAKLIQGSLYKNIKRQDAQVLNIGIKMAPFVVLSQTGVPSVLVEISCISKLEQEAKLASVNYRSDIADYLQEGIAAYLEMQNTIISDRRIQQ
nr:N-acetylmuramoyl-L-alanine amidase [uncultured Desulfobacter sp.]